MNKLEFNEIVEEFGINDYLMKDVYCRIRRVYFWNNIEMFFSDSYYTVVTGKIPLEVANIIYEKYPNNPYGIRIDGGCFDYIPSKHAVDDQYIREYHIDSKEGFIIFLSELRDYYARKYGLPATEVQKYNEILSNVCSKILKKLNPYITTYEWMEGAESDNSESFINAVIRDKATSFGYVFRKALDQFDKTVNPYINEDIELDSIDSYLQRVNIGANTYDYDEDEGKYRENCCVMQIKERTGENRTIYYRSPNGFSYQLKYILGPKEGLTVLHYFDNKGDKKSDKGEHLYISYYGENSKQKVDLRYNITQGLSGETYKEKTPITPEQMIFVYAELVKAIELASTITIDNMKKKNYSKKLVPDQK